LQLVKQKAAKHAANNSFFIIIFLFNV